jgi:hypothetical protein
MFTFQALNIATQCYFPSHGGGVEFPTPLPPLATPLYIVVVAGK